MQELATKKRFANNQLKSNCDTCHLIISTNDIAENQIEDFSVKSSSSEKLLGVNIDSKLNFDSHVNHLYSNANKKLRALVRVTTYMA